MTESVKLLAKLFLGAMLIEAGRELVQDSLNQAKELLNKK